MQHWINIQWADWMYVVQRFCKYIIWLQVQEQICSTRVGGQMVLLNRRCRVQIWRRILFKWGENESHREESHDESLSSNIRPNSSRPNWPNIFLSFVIVFFLINFFGSVKISVDISICCNILGFQYLFLPFQFFIH